MKMNELERSIYGAAFAHRFDEERKAAVNAAIAEVQATEERDEAIQAERWRACAESAIEYAEAAVGAHRDARAARRARRAG